MMPGRSKPQSTTGFADANGARLFWEARGAGDIIVLIHAGVADSRMWEPQMTAFAPYFRVIRYDARGFGRSQPGSSSFSYCGDLIAILDALQVDRAHLVGISMGGSTALEAALEAPDRVSSLVLGATAPRGLVSFDELVPAWEEIDRLIDAGQYDEANEIEVQMWVDGPRRGPDQVDPAVRGLVAEMNRPLLSAPAGPLQVQLEPPAVERLDQIMVPTLVLAGEYDQPSQIAGPKLLAARIPGAEFQMIAGGAHMLNLEQPDTFNDAVLSFLRRHGAPAS